MNDRVITSAMVAAVMKFGQSSHARGIAATFDISPGAMRKILDVAVADGAIESRTSNGVRLFSLPISVTPAKAAKQLTVSREMRAAQERCKELRVHPSKY